MTARTQRKKPAGTHLHRQTVVMSWHIQIYLHSGLCTLGCCLKGVESLIVTAYCYKFQSAFEQSA